MEDFGLNQEEQEKIARFAQRIGAPEKSIVEACIGVVQFYGTDQIIKNLAAVITDAIKRQEKWRKEREIDS